MDKTLPEIAGLPVKQQMQMYGLLSHGYDDGDYFYINGAKFVIRGQYIIGQDEILH